MGYDMTGLIEKLKERMKAKICFSQYSLNIIRFKKVLEYSKKLMALFEDGREKSKGEYIFDFHYVASLIEKIADTLDKIVYNAAVLEPRDSYRLYMTLDTYRNEARKMILSAKSPKKVNLPHNDPSSGGLPEPEYFLLEKVISWFDGSTQNSVPYVKSFMADVFSHILASDSVFKPPEEETEITVNCGGSFCRINALFFPEAGDFSDPFEECQKFSVPFQLLTSWTECREEKKEMNPLITKKWHAFFDNDYLSMILSDGKEIDFKLDSYAGGFTDADFVFVYSKNMSELSGLKGLVDIITSKDKSYGWCFGRNISEIEKVLAQTGKVIFGADYDLKNSGSAEINRPEVQTI